MSSPCVFIASCEVALTAGGAAPTLAAVHEKDALLFELLELTNLAFPRPPRAVELIFAPNDAGDGPALTDLRARPRDGAPERPDLGYDDEEIEDGMQAALVELLAAISSDRGEPVLAGKLTLVEDLASGGVIATTTSQTGEVVHRRHIDKSERTESVHTAELFALLDAHARDEAALVERSRALSAAGARFALDSEQGTVALTTKSVTTTHRAHAVATYHPGESSLSWAWANDPLPDVLRAKVDEIRRAVRGPGLAAFTREELSVPEKMARRLVAHAAARMGAALLLVIHVEGEGGAPIELSLALDDAR